MSIRSYRRNVARGVTGRNFETCLPSAFEQVSPRHQLDPDVYREFIKFITNYSLSTKREAHRTHNARRHVLNSILDQLGGYQYEDLVCYHIDSAAELRDVVPAHLRNGDRVVAAFDPYGDGYNFHMIGILPTEQPRRFRLVSNWVPRTLGGLVTLSQVFPELAQEIPTAPAPDNFTAFDERYESSNLVIIPSE